MVPLLLEKRTIWFNPDHIITILLNDHTLEVIDSTGLEYTYSIPETISKETATKFIIEVGKGRSK